MSNVLLLRARSSDGPDKYEQAFSAVAYHPLCVPVLETVLTGLPELRRTIEDGPRRFGGVIVTSARSCEAWRDAVSQIVQDSPGDIRPAWNTIPFYVVGAATASALSSIRTALPHAGPLAPTNIRGADSGTGEKLAHFILGDLARDATRRLLYLTGDKNRDVLPSILRDGGVTLEPLQVYATQGSSAFAEDLERAITGVPPERQDKDWWIVFFAPSAAEFVTPTLRKHFAIPDVDSQTFSAKIAAIGPTTSTFLHDKLNMRVDVLSPKPSPDALVDAIQNFDAQSNT